MIGIIKARLTRKLRIVKNAWWVYLSIQQAKNSGGRLYFTEKPNLASPLKCNGSGSVSLIGKVSIGYGKGPMLGSGENIIQARTPESKITLGSETITSNNITLIACSEISIGNRCQIGDLVSIYDCDFHEIDPSTRNDSIGEVSPVHIGSNVWLGSRVMVLKGVTIGDNSVIAAGSIVTKSIPSNCLAAGIPAKVVRKI